MKSDIYVSNYIYYKSNFITDLIIFSGHHNIIFFNTLVLYFRYLFFCC
jgi:hypothetical protein